MAMGRQRSAPEQALFVATSEISAAENPFYRALNGLLGENSTTLEANAAMRSIVRRDEGTSYEPQCPLCRRP